MHKLAQDIRLFRILAGLRWRASIEMIEQFGYETVGDLQPLILPPLAYTLKELYIAHNIHYTIRGYEFKSL